MELLELAINDIHPYSNNPRKNDEAVQAVMESIKQCEYVAPIVVDEDHVILAGHTRLKALKKLGYKTVPVIVKEGLTEDQRFCDVIIKRWESFTGKKAVKLHEGS